MHACSACVAARRRASHNCVACVLRSTGGPPPLARSLAFRGCRKSGQRARRTGKEDLFIALMKTVRDTDYVAKPTVGRGLWRKSSAADVLFGRR